MNYRKKLQETIVDILKDLSITTHESYENHEDEVNEQIDYECETAVTYIKDAYEIMLGTKNDDAYLDNMIDLDASQGASYLITQMAYHAFQQDLHELLDNVVSTLPLYDENAPKDI